MNVIEAQNSVGALSDDELMSEMGSPSGAVPQYLVLTELTKRRDMRGAAKGGPAPTTTVAEEVVNELRASGVPPMEGPQGFAEGGIVGWPRMPTTSDPRRFNKDSYQLPAVGNSFVGNIFSQGIAGTPYGMSYLSHLAAGDIPNRQGYTDFVADRKVEEQGPFFNEYTAADPYAGDGAPSVAPSRFDPANDLGATGIAGVPSPDFDDGYSAAGAGAQFLPDAGLPGMLVAEAGGSKPSAANLGLGSAAPAGALPAGVNASDIYDTAYEDQLKTMNGRTNHLDPVAARLAEMEANAEGRRGSALNMALMQAGLGIASSDSPHLMQAIGEGGLGALDGYRGEMSDIRSGEMQRLGVQATIASGNESRDTANIDAAMRMAESRTGNATRGADQELERYKITEGVRQSDRAAGLDEQRLTTDRERLDVDRERIAAQERISNKPPAEVQTFEAFAEMGEEGQKKYIEFLKAHKPDTDLRMLNTASSAWKGAKATVDSALEDGNITYATPAYRELVVKASGGDEDAVAQLKAYVDGLVRKEFTGTYPQYAALAGAFDQNAAVAANNAGLNITTAPGKGASVRPLR